MSIESQNDWICKNCGKAFQPMLDKYICPDCGSNNTISNTVLKRIAEEKQRQIAKELERRNEEKHCPECDSIMHFGFLVERNSPLQVFTLGEGVYWTPSEAGLAGSLVALNSWACPECGYVCLNVRSLSVDRTKILNAPTFQ
jgi:rubrerythrin